MPPVAENLGGDFQGEETVVRGKLTEVTANGVIMDWEGGGGVECDRDSEMRASIAAVYDSPVVINVTPDFWAFPQPSPHQPSPHLHGINT